MNIKIFCRCSLILPGQAKHLSAPLYLCYYYLLTDEIRMIVTRSYEFGKSFEYI